MGYGIYLKASVNKQGKSSLFYLIKSGSNQIKRGLGIKVKPSDFNARTYQVHAKAENSRIYNEKINDVETKLKKAWSLYESDTYDWEEMVAYLGGAKTEMDVWTFCETILKNENTENVQSGIKDAYGGVKKVLGKESLSFDDLTEKTVNTCVKDWKERLRSATLKTYKYHFGLIINGAYEKKLVEKTKR
jgi:hypothetical protein